MSQRVSRSHVITGRVWLFGVVLLPAVLLAACDASTEPESDTTPFAIVKLAGDGLTAPQGTALPGSPTVEVRNADGMPLPDVTVTFTLTSGDGLILPTTQVTDENGQASVLWILGWTLNVPHVLQATAGGALANFTASPMEALPGRSYTDTDGYVEYVAGNLPLVISAPHGGYLTPAEIPDRTWGILTQDRNTQELALEIQDALLEETGGYPHLVISHLHRTKLDPNREIEEAAQGAWAAERAWWRFQTYIEAAKTAVTRDFAEGFYIDLHGHGHEIPRVELGYLLDSGTLALSDEVLNSTDAYAEASSIRSLAQTTDVGFAGLLRGIVSLGGLLETRGIPAVPSPFNPDPGGAEYFSGGYNTARHGSRGGTAISGVQIECHYPGLRDTAEGREAFALHLARSLEVYFLAHFSVPLAPQGSSAPSSTLR